ncbi:MAG TPA: nitroreductase/quinone reductase family protein [Acidimicrobiia bacterium]|jgi:deazaflavin-dependent oxidoreductase (nitroreductase family)
MARAPQRNDPFEEPPFEQIPEISRMHAQAMESTDADIVWQSAGMHQVIVYTVGRRSGNEHRVVVPVWFDDDGHRIVVASYAGAARDPHWYLNLCDKVANPEVRVRAQDHEFWADAQVLDGHDYDETWEALTTDRPYYLDYQTRTTRRIPLVRLVEVRPAG